MTIANEPETSGRPVTGLFLVCLAAALWATVGVANSFIANGKPVDPAVAGLLRTTLGAGFLILIAEIKKTPRTGDGKYPLCALFLIGLAGAVFQMTLFEAFSTIGVTITVAVTVCAPPLIVALGEAIVLRRPPGRWMLSALAIATVGVMMVLTDSKSTGFGAVDISSRAVFLLAAASISFAAIAVLVRVTSRKIHPIRAAGNGLMITAVILLGVVVFRSESRIPVLSTTDIAIMIYIGIAATGGAYLAFVHGMKLCHTAGAGLAATMIEPVLAALFAALLLSERLSSIESFGCALMLLAMITLYASERKAEQTRN